MRGSASLPTLPLCRSPGGCAHGNLASVPPAEASGRSAFTGRSSWSRRAALEVPGSRSQQFRRDFEDAYESLSRHRYLMRLEKLFLLTDIDGSGSVTIDELQEALRTHPAQAMFGSLGVQPHQAIMIFKAFDRNCDGELSRDEFISGVACLSGPGIDGCCSGEVDTDKLRPANFEKCFNTALHPRSATACAPPIGHRQLPEVNAAGSRSPSYRAFVHSAVSQALHPASAERP
eukprot:CAMPEP_0176090694 /NCGR_PEP_ID=MMETSP0120_2-20121206/45421_1 /TAXON_ID=160619 /ORGANISM="Kryptoperidinium foliaceum, Strain CCMP 1326" /LENGTH=231 /DNA_ID=CAMNT_0017424575 /DNA_START=1 /DNA_END=692 /DNA_ORIENTATION=+